MPTITNTGHTYTGQAGLVEEALPGEHWTPERGLVVTRVYRGTPDEVDAEAAACQAQGVPYRIAPGMEGGYRRIEILEPTANNGVVLSQRDDLIGQDVEKDLMQDASLESLQPDVLQILQYAITQYDTQAASYAATRSLLSYQESINSLPANTLVNIFLDHAAGIRSTLLSTYIIRRTANFQRGAGVQAQFALNVHKVFTTASDLDAHETIDPNRLWNIPAGQWLKRTPTYIVQPNGQVTVTVEWWWGKQISLRYPRVT